MRRKRKTRKKRSGIKLAALLVAACAIAGAGDRKKDEAHAVVAGTVFHDPGFALPGATVVIAVDDAGGDNGHFKPRKTLADGRGEFAFRVPPAAAHYVLRVSAKGYEPQEKKAEVSDPEERVDVNFILMPKSKQEPK